MWKIYEHLNKVCCQIVREDGGEYTTSSSRGMYYTVEDREVQPWGLISSDWGGMIEFDAGRLNDAIELCVKKNAEDYPSWKYSKGE